MQSGTIWASQKIWVTFFLGITTSKGSLPRSALRALLITGPILSPDAIGRMCLSDVKAATLLCAEGTLIVSGFMLITPKSMHTPSLNTGCQR